jgi:hypothetical protein
VKPLVVAALQSPTLLNIWAESDCWKLEVAPLGDCDLAEARLLKAPRYEQGEPRAVLVCSPEHIERARGRWPGIKIVWVHHNARTDLFPIECQERADHRIVLAESIALAQKTWNAEPPVSVIVPHYLPVRRFRWRPNTLWTMMSRPRTRHEEHLSMMAEMIRRLGTALTVYGEDQPASFLGVRGKRELVEGSSAYVSSLPPWSGFGLAEHEMFAAGVPVIGPRWADIVSEMPDEYTTLCAGSEANVLAAKLLAGCQHCAEHFGEMGLEFVSQFRTRQRMDEGIEQFLEAL